MSFPDVGNYLIFAAMAGAEGMRADDGESGGDGADHFVHAAGRTCKNCDQPIEKYQPARRRGVDDWVHDVCPPVFDS